MDLNAMCLLQEHKRLFDSHVAQANIGTSSCALHRLEYKFCHSAGGEYGKVEHPMVDRYTGSETDRYDSKTRLSPARGRRRWRSGCSMGPAVHLRQALSSSVGDATDSLAVRFSVGPGQKTLSSRVLHPVCTTAPLRGAFCSIRILASCSVSMSQNPIRYSACRVPSESGVDPPQ